MPGALADTQSPKALCLGQAPGGELLASSRNFGSGQAAPKSREPPRAHHAEVAPHRAPPHDGVGVAQANGGGFWGYGGLTSEPMRNTEPMRGAPPEWGTAPLHPRPTGRPTDPQAEPSQTEPSRAHRTNWTYRPTDPWTCRPTIWVGAPRMVFDCSGMRFCSNAGKHPSHFLRAHPTTATDTVANDQRIMRTASNTQRVRMGRG